MKAIDWAEHFLLRHKKKARKEKTWLKALAVALTATMAFGTLTGCNKSGNDTTTTTDASQNETTTTEAASNGETPANTGIEACTIEFWHAMNNKQEEELTALTNKFNETNEYGITVNLYKSG